MNQKPKIQYVGQFYIHGSEARQLELQEKKKHAKSKLPLERLRKVEVIYLDPVAIFGIVTALVLLAVMTVGVLQIRDDWKDYQTMSNYVSRLNSENAELKADYRSQYDLEDIRVKANGRVYNLNGQYVGNSLNGLQPGIYIQNGKKVVVK